MIKVIGPITADTFRDYLKQVVQPEEGFDFNRWWEIVISGPGGDVGYTLAMLDDIDEHKRNTRATGICENESAVLACAGEGKRVCTMDTLFRFVPPKAESWWNPETEKIEPKVPDRIYYLHSMLVARLASRMHIDKVEVYDLFDGEFISSSRAKELGLVDEVISTAPSTKIPEYNDWSGTAGLQEGTNGNSDRLSGSEECFVEPESTIVRSRCGTFISGRDVRVQPAPETTENSSNS